MLNRLAKLWRCSADEADNRLRTHENDARLVVSRRAFFGAVAVTAAPTRLYSFAVEPEADHAIWVDPWTGLAEQTLGRPAILGMWAYLWTITPSPNVAPIL